MEKARLSDSQLVYFCPGCGRLHSVPADRWNWNGSTESPTLSPSVLHFYEHPKTKQRETVCHYFIREGNIQYCSDSPHELAGQTISMVDVAPT